MSSLWVIFFIIWILYLQLVQLSSQVYKLCVCSFSITHFVIPSVGLLKRWTNFSQAITYVNTDL